MRIYLPEEVILTKTARVDISLYLPKWKSIPVLLYAFLTVKENCILSLVILHCSKRSTY